MLPIRRVYLQVLGTIVSRHVIAMVDTFTRKQRATKHLFNDEDML